MNINIYTHSAYKYNHTAYKWKHTSWKINLIFQKIRVYKTIITCK